MNAVPDDDHNIDVPKKDRKTRRDAEQFSKFRNKTRSRHDKKPAHIVGIHRRRNNRH